jgi:hypothetical protein
MHFDMTPLNASSSGWPSVAPLTGAVSELYAVYFEVAKRDHACRIAALYGTQAPPVGHTPFRPLPMEHFEARFQSATREPGGEMIFRRQLARQARVYGVDISHGRQRRAA